MGRILGNCFLSTENTEDAEDGNGNFFCPRRGAEGHGGRQHLFDPLRGAKGREEHLLSTEDAEGAEKGNTF